jgi:anti-sigma B factor antagonist
MLAMSTQQLDEATIVELRGSASMGEIDAFTRQTDRLAAARPRLLVLDLTRLDFLASLAIGQIVALSKSIKLHGGKVVLAGPNPEVLKVLDRCNLRAVLPVFATVDQAINTG